MEKVFYKGLQIDIDIFEATKGCEKEEQEYRTMLEHYSDKKVANAVELVQSGLNTLAACYSRHSLKYFETVYQNASKSRT